MIPKPQINPSGNKISKISSISSIWSSKRVKFIFFVSLFLLAFLFPLESARAYHCNCPPCRSECGEQWTECTYEYKARPSIYCVPKKGPDIYRRARMTVGCCGEHCTCRCVICDPEKKCEDCGSWQIATRITQGENICDQGICPATLWGLIKPECKACVDCLEAPENPRYYDNALYPLDPYHPEPGQKNDDIHLPVKLDWDDVEGWIEGWRLPEKKVVKKNYAGERCEIQYEAGQDLVNCQINCKNECWIKMEKEWKGPEKNPGSKWNIGNPQWANERAQKEVEKEIEYRDYLPKCIRECEKDCIEKHKTSAGGICPYTGTVFHCDPPIDYIKSYIIEIKGKDKSRMRNPEALEKIAILEREIELIESGFFDHITTFPEEINEKLEKIEKNKKEIERIVKDELKLTMYGAALDKSEFIPALTPEKGTGWLENGGKISILSHSINGFFQSNQNYQWRVRACIREYKSYEQYEKAGGYTCGPWSPWWEFKTNPAPEPGLPYDPDWNGKREDYPANWSISGIAKELPKWAVRFLRWSEIDDEKEAPHICKKWYQSPEGGEKKGYILTLGEILSQLREYCSPWSFKVLFHYKYKENETAKCHPQEGILKGECLPKKVQRDPGWPGTGTYVARPEMPNEKYKYFTKLTFYDWQLQACIDDGAEQCSDFSQKWQFFPEDFTLKKSTNITPPDDKEIETGLPVLIEWTDPEGALSYIYQVKNEKGGNIKSGKQKATGIAFDYDPPFVDLDTLYSWKVKPCWDYKSKMCENFWSDSFYFKTTGRPPKPETMKPTSEQPVPIPTTFEWEAVPGAKSYIFTLKGGEIGAPEAGGLKQIVKEPKLTLDYPNLYQDNSYAWEVETCAREKGEICGTPSLSKTFKTFKLSLPQNPNPSDNGQLSAGEKNYFLSWEKVPYAKFYHYKLEYIEVSPEEKEPESCQTGFIIPEPKIVSTPQGMIIPKNITPSTQSEPISLKCLGKYELSVKACLDEACASPGSASDWSVWHFELLPSSKPPPSGILPCSRGTDNPQTPWDEAKPCEIKHLFVILRNLIDFLLWKIGPILLALLVLVTGGIYYFSMGAPTTIIDIKSLWKAAGIGYGIIFLAWIIVDLILLIFGYRVGIFGPWWQFNW